MLLEHLTACIRRVEAAQIKDARIDGERLQAEQLETVR